MADKKISELTELTAPDGAEELVVNDGGTSKKITVDNLFNQDIDVTGGVTCDALIVSGTENTVLYGNSTDATALIALADNGGSINIINSSGDLRFKTGGSANTSGIGSTERMRITSTGVGIGTSSPNAKLEIASSEGNANTPPELRITNTYTAYSSTGTLENTHHRIGFYNNEASGQGAHLVATIDSKLRNNYGNTHDIAISSDDGSGNLTERVRFPYTGGITFNGDTAAANALEEYETGTWTGFTVKDSSNNALVSGTDFSMGATKYTKIGNIVRVDFRLRDMRATKTTLRVDGVPFSTNSHDICAGMTLYSNFIYIHSLGYILVYGTSEWKHGFFTYEAS